MKKGNKIFLIALSLFLFGGIFGVFDVETNAQEPDQGRAFHQITITLPRDRGTWTADARPASAQGNHVITATLPAHAIEARIITGTNATPGATTGWQSHSANQVTNRTHFTMVGPGVPIRPQFRATTNRAAFTSGGSWSP